SVLVLLWGGFVVGMTLALLDALFGVSRPLIGQVTEDSIWWKRLLKFSGNRSNRLIVNLRFQQLYDLLFRYLTEIGLDQVPVIAPMRDWVSRRLYGDTETTISGLPIPAQTRIMLQNLGPTFVKFGQMVSSRSEALPPDWQKELDKLQSNVAPFPGEIAVATVEQEFGKPITELFATFEVTPFAAASTAQVHKATLADGTQVVVKVQRPNIVPKVQADLLILHDALATLARFTPWIRDNNVLGIFEQFAANLRVELDYRNEAYQARRLAENMTTYPTIHVPAIYGHLTSSKVMTMELVSGVKVNRVEEIDAAGLDRPQLAHTFFSAMLKQIIFDGYFHGDCHPGNVMIDLETGEIIFLDMGMMGTLDQQGRMNLADLIWSLNAMDPYELTQSLLRLCTPYRDVDAAAFSADVERVVLRYMRYPLEAGSLSEVLNATFSVLNNNGLRLGSDLTMALKTLVQAEEIVHVLDSELNIPQAAFGYIQSYLTQQLTPENVQTMVRTQLLRTTRELVRRVPDLQGAALKWFDQFERGKLELEINTDELNERLDIFNLAAQRLAIGLVLLGMVIGSAFATNIDAVVLGINIAVLAFVIFVIAMGISVVMIYHMVTSIEFKPRRRPRIRQ
ncbi:MAG: hypothetical protein KAX65_16630, partial [Caldilineaceae bacterium]|nr:hypothetical protein [Caldilineaceae bacterium]